MQIHFYFCDFFSFRILLFIAVVTPYRIAFIDIDSLDWVLIDLAVDIIFAIDIILNFLTAYFDDDDNLITSRKIIACSYLKSWFFVDLIATIPISSILKFSKDYNSLARIARLPRLYRLLKITK